MPPKGRTNLSSSGEQTQPTHPAHSRESLAGFCDHVFAQVDPVAAVSIWPIPDALVGWVPAGQVHTVVV